MIMHRPTWFVIPLCTLMLASCGSTTSGVVRFVNPETHEDFSVDDGTQRVQVRVRDGNTVVKLRHATFVFLDYRGYKGRIGSGEGYVTVGKVTLSYDRFKASVRGDRKWVKDIDLTHGPNLWVRQDGSTGRNVFRD